MITIVVPKTLSLKIDIKPWKDNLNRSHKMISMIESFYFHLDPQERATKIFYSMDSCDSPEDEALYYEMVQNYFQSVHGKFLRP